MQFPYSALAKVKIKLERIAGSDAIGLYLSIIETGAIRELQQGQQYNTQRHEEILVELNRLVRKFERSLVAEANGHRTSLETQIGNLFDSVAAGRVD